MAVGVNYWMIYFHFSPFEKQIYLYFNLSIFGYAPPDDSVTDPSTTYIPLHCEEHCSRKKRARNSVEGIRKKEKKDKKKVKKSDGVLLITALWNVLTPA